MNIFKSRKTIIVALILVVFGFSQAHANSRFTVQNNSSDKIKVFVYSGDDSTCAFEAKSQYVGSGNEKSMGCAGGGKHRCKAYFAIVAKDGSLKDTCNELRNTCNHGVAIVDNHSTVVISGNRSDGESISCKIVPAD